MEKNERRVWKRKLWLFLVVLGVGAAVWAVWAESRFMVVYVCVGLGALGLGILHGMEKRLSTDALRVWADVVLLTPLAGVWLGE